jgi:DNA-directed RNA polymerase subunit RPC12/RpoP
MIEFACKSCGQKLKVGEEHSGRRVKCPKCGGAGVVPDDSGKIKFHCESCGQSISVPQIHAGKKGKCPKCKTPIAVPALEREPVGSAPPAPPVPSVAGEDLYEDEPDLPEEAEGPDRRLILVICGVAAVVVVGLIILVAFVLPSGSGPAEEPYQPPGREAADVDSQSSRVASDAEPADTFTLQPPKPDAAPKEPARSSAAASDAAGNLDLKLRLKPGQEHELQKVKEIHSSRTVRGRRSDEEYVNTMGLEIKVEQVGTNGVAWLKVTYLTIHERRRDEQGQLAHDLGYASEYDSTKPETAVSYMNYGPLFTAMIGQSFRAKVTPEGEIVELEGLAEMYAQMAELVVENEDEAIRLRMAKTSTEKGEERAKKSVDQRNQRYGSREKRIEARRERLEDSGHSAKGVIKEMLANVIMPFPGVAVGIGDSWQGKTALFSLGAGDIGLDDCTYTLRETRQAAVLVDISSKIEVNDEHLYGEEGNLGSSTMTLAGSCEGSLEIDPGTGWMLHKTVTMHYSGEMKMAPTEQSPQGLTMVMSTEVVTKVEPMKEAVSPGEDL